jgi:hypothetical protein
MKYMIVKLESFGTEFTNVITTLDDINFISFPAVVGNPNYDAFLAQADLTDEEVHALPVDEWIEL